MCVWGYIIIAHKDAHLSMQYRRQGGSWGYQIGTHWCKAAERDAWTLRCHTCTKRYKADFFLDMAYLHTKCTDTWQQEKGAWRDAKLVHKHELAEERRLWELTSLQTPMHRCKAGERFYLRCNAWTHRCKAGEREFLEKPCLHIKIQGRRKSIPGEAMLVHKIQGRRKGIPGGTMLAHKDTRQEKGNYWRSHAYT